MSILVTGGAGYIGSHTVSSLLDKNYDVVIIDDLSKGHKESLMGGKLYVGNLKDGEFLNKVFNENKITSVIHFAAYSLVGESMTDPLKYYDNNVYSTIKLLEYMNKYNVKNIVFSSTAATYGNPQSIPIQENDITIPTNPYGESKLAIEKMLKWADNAYGIKYTILRYFNACGAHPSGRIGEFHDPETHLIPIILNTALGKQQYVNIFGDDYDTPDGTCIRDYIHVCDLASAHILAVEKLESGVQSSIYNLGNGTGFSVKEIIEASKKITKVDIETKISQRRVGDPAILVASSDKAKRELGWNPTFSNINTIIESAWNWHKNGGYHK